MSASAWEAPTRAWVDAGWVADEHREALQAWLDANRPPAEPSPFLDVALMVGVTVGNWLLVGALVLAVGLLLPGADDLLPWIAVGAGGVQFAAGALFRVIGSRVLAQGFFSAWVPVTVIGATFALDWPLRGLELLLLPVVLAPVALALAIAAWDRMPGLAGNAGLAAVAPLGVAAADHPSGGPELVAIAMTLAVVAGVAIGRLGGERGAAMLPAVPFATGIGLWALTWHKAWIPKALIAVPWAWETGLVATAVGLALLAGGAVAQSRWVLVSGVGALIYSEVVLLIAVGNFWVGVAVLGGEGMLLVGGAVALLAVRTLGAKRRQDEGDAGS